MKLMTEHPREQSCFSYPSALIEIRSGPFSEEGPYEGCDNLQGHDRKPSNANIQENDRDNPYPLTDGAEVPLLNKGVDCPRLSTTYFIVLLALHPPESELRNEPHPLNEGSYFNFGGNLGAVARSARHNQRLCF